MDFKIITPLNEAQCYKIIDDHNKKIRHDAKALHEALADDKDTPLLKRKAALMLKHYFKITRQPIEWLYPDLKRFAENDTARVVMYNSDFIVIWIDDEYVKFCDLGMNIFGGDIRKDMRKEFKATNIEMI